MKSLNEVPHGSAVPISVHSRGKQARLKLHVVSKSAVAYQSPVFTLPTNQIWRTRVGNPAEGSYRTGDTGGDPCLSHTAISETPREYTTDSYPRAMTPSHSPCQGPTLLPILSALPSRSHPRPYPTRFFDSMAASAVDEEDPAVGISWVCNNTTGVGRPGDSFLPSLLPLSEARHHAAATKPRERKLPSGPHRSPKPRRHTPRRPASGHGDETSPDPQTIRPACAGGEPGHPAWLLRFHPAPASCLAAKRPIPFSSLPSRAPANQTGDRDPSIGPRTGRSHLWWETPTPPGADRTPAGDRNRRLKRSMTAH